MTHRSIESLYETPASAKTESGKGADPVSSTEQPAPTDPPSTETPPLASTEVPAAGTGEPPSKAKDGKSDAPPASEDELPKDVQGLQSALKDERRKRKERDAKIAEAETNAAEAKRTAAVREELLRQVLAQKPQPAPAGQQPQVPDPWSDPEAAMAYQRDLNAAQLFQTRVELSQDIMRSQHKDYDDIEAIFTEEAKRNPGLVFELQRHPAPARYAYQAGKQLKLLREIGPDASSWEANKEAELRDKVRAELEAEYASRRPTVPTVPTAPPPQSLAGVPSVTPRNISKTNQGPTPLADLYK